MLAGPEPHADAGGKAQVHQRHVVGEALQADTRAVVVLRANGSALPIERGAMTRSDRGRVLQTAPGLRRAPPGSARRRQRRGPRPRRRGLCRCRTRLAAGEGEFEAARCAASSTDSFGSQGKRSVGVLTEIWKVMPVLRSGCPWTGRAAPWPVSEPRCERRSREPKGTGQLPRGRSPFDAPPSRGTVVTGTSGAWHMHHNGSASSVSMREESHTTSRLTNFRSLPVAPHDVEIDAGREHVGLPVVHDAHDHERRLGFGLVAAVPGHARQPEDMPIGLLLVDIGLAQRRDAVDQHALGVGVDHAGLRSRCGGFPRW